MVSLDEFQKLLDTDMQPYIMKGKQTIEGYRVEIPISNGYLAIILDTTRRNVNSIVNAYTPLPRQF